MIVTNHKASSAHSSLTLYKVSASNFKPKAFFQLQSTKHILSDQPGNFSWEENHFKGSTQECIYDIPTDLDESEDLGPAEPTVFGPESHCQ